MIERKFFKSQAFKIVIMEEKNDNLKIDEVPSDALAYVWLKKTKGGQCQVSFKVGAKDAWRCYVAPMRDLHNFLSGNYDMVKFNLVDNLKKKSD